MPTEAPRKSSIGNLRRGPPKAHVPYRGDNREVGKKTGVKIPRVQPGSDGFEPFENVIGQADAMTPYQVKGRKRNGSLAAGEVDPGDDDEGERSMDIDSPFDYISNSRQPISPALSRVGSSRAVARPSMNNFDELPSPHLRTGFNARGANGHSAGPSRLSRHFPSDGEDDLSINNNTFDDFDPEPPESSPQHHRSFTELDQDGDDADPSSPAASPRSLKQRQRQTPRRSPSPPVDPDSPSPPQSDIEMGPPQDYDDPMQQEEEEEEEEEAPPKKKPSPPPKKAKEVQKKAVTKSGGKKENREVIPGTRRSSRKVYKPLEYWRNERVVYGRPNNGHILVPHIKEIIRIPEEPKAPLGTNKRKRGRSKTVQPRDGSVARVQSNPEEGWDDKTPEKSFVIDWKTKTEVEKRITCLAKSINPQPAANNEWLFQKIFGDDQFIAAGQLVIPVDGRKPSKSTKDNTYIFYIIEGAINLRVHESSLLLCTGAMFMVPRGNHYYIENVGTRDAKLFFTQARKIEDADEQERAEDARSVPPRSSSTAGPAVKPKPGPSKRAKTSGA